MRLHSHDPHRYRLYYNCPIKRPTRRKGQIRWVIHRQECPQAELCQPQTQMGPIIYTRTEDDPRLYPLIPRHSQELKDLMAHMSGCERGNSLKKSLPRTDVRGRLPSEGEAPGSGPGQDLGVFELPILGRPFFHPFFDLAMAAAAYYGAFVLKTDRLDLGPFKEVFLGTISWLLAAKLAPFHI